MSKLRPADLSLATGAAGDKSNDTPRKLPKRLRKLDGHEHETKGLRGQAPNLVVSDKGHAARTRLYSEAPNDYRDINRSWTVSWLRHRMREYVNIHGHASAGVCALLERAAEQYADSDYLRATAASEGATPAALRQAAQHAQLARSHELAAWELAAREGPLKRQLDALADAGGGLAKQIREDVRNDRATPDSWGGVGVAEVEGWKDDPVPTFSPPGGSKVEGTLFPASPSKPDSALPLSVESATVEPEDA